ncbi:MAG TPA: glycosyl hydrolase family 28-related protein, partial [Tepidisphaeraceae bacterium]|nr:glycosyl hydrolase family 28-related protein [Tepidisphaeraceae bacterium]
MSGRPCVDQSDISQRRRSRRRPRRLALMENLELRRLLSAIPLPNIPNRTFNITNYGAVADGVTDNTAAIQSAINAAVAAGGGKVEVPAAAKPFESGPLTLKNYINLQVDAGATLQMLPYGT